MNRISCGLLATFGISMVCSPVKANCLAALTPTEIGQTNDLAFEYAYLKTINENNYEEHRKSGNAGAQILDIPASASYDQFDQARREFSSRFDEKLKLQIKSSYVFNGVTAAGYEAYATCLRLTSNAPLAAWVEKYNKQIIIVKVKSFLPSSYKATLNALGVTPLNSIAPFSGSGEQEIAFARPQDDDFLVAFQLVGQDQAPFVGTTVELGAPINARVEHTEEVLHNPAHCGAGCHGSTTGCQNVQNVDITPKNGYQFAKDVNMNETGNTGIAILHKDYAITSENLKTQLSCEADQGATQKFINLDVTVTQYRDIIVSGN